VNVRGNSDLLLVNVEAEFVHVLNQASHHKIIWGSGILNSVALLPGKESLVLIGWDAELAPEPVRTQWRREKNLCSDRESNPGRPTRSLVTVLTALPRL
jgi:hypothetical protein